MKSNALIVFIFLSFSASAQLNSIVSNTSISETSIDDNSLKKHFATNLYFAQNYHESEISQQMLRNETSRFLNHSNFIVSPPLLTTSLHALEICAGNSTQLTANSEHTVFWYTTPPPLGSPVGTGTSYITPELHAGYYTYYAIAENNGVKSDFTAMEVVMVYPNPTLSIVSSASNLCSNQTATLSVSGTTFYEWENGPVSSNITIRPTATQEFKVRGVNTAGCATSAVYTQMVISCSNSNDTESANERFIDSDKTALIERLFSVYPNPNNGDFKIAVNYFSEATRVEIYSSLGVLTYSGKISSELTEINLRDYSNGIYIVRIIENNKVLNQEKVIKE